MRQARFHFGDEWGASLRTIASTCVYLFFFVCTRRVNARSCSAAPTPQFFKSIHAMDSFFPAEDLRSPGAPPGNFDGVYPPQVHLSAQGLRPAQALRAGQPGLPSARVQSPLPSWGAKTKAPAFGAKPTWHKRSAAQRREQQRRAEGRRVLHVIRAFESIGLHRGNSLGVFGQAYLAALHTLQASRESKSGARPATRPGPGFGDLVTRDDNQHLGSHAKRSESPSSAQAPPVGTGESSSTHPGQGPPSFGDACQTSPSSTQASVPVGASGSALTRLGLCPPSGGAGLTTQKPLDTEHLLSSGNDSRSHSRHAPRHEGPRVTAPHVAAPLVDDTDVVFCQRARLKTYTALRSRAGLSERILEVMASACEVQPTSHRARPPASLSQRELDELDDHELRDLYDAMKQHRARDAL